MIGTKTGCEVLIRFTCGRCGKKATQKHNGAGRVHIIQLDDITPPDGWTDCTRVTPVLCDTCTEAFKSFLRGDPAMLPLNISPQTAAAMQEMDRQAHGFYFDEDHNTSGLLEED